MSKWTDVKTLNRIILGVLALAVLGTAAAFIYNLSAPPAEKFTEFYILGAMGEATDYPVQIKVGEEAIVTLGIINREQTSVSYRVGVRAGSDTIDSVGPINLRSNEKHEMEMTFTLDKPGDKQKVEFLLYKEGQNEVLESVYLLVSATQ